MAAGLGAGGGSLGDAARLFDGTRLALARHLAGLRKNALADAVGKSATAIAAYESGSKKPASATVAQLSLALGVEPEFFMPGPVAVNSTTGSPHFRSLRSTTQIARDQAYAYGRLAVGVAAVLERRVELPLRDVPDMHVSANDIDDDGAPDAAARTVRALWGLSNGPIGHLVRTAEQHGVLVVFSPEQTASVDAYSFDNPFRPVVLLNAAKKDYYRQRFDLAHELGHLVMHADAEPGGRVVEEQAHRFAAELLMPRAELLDELPRKADWTRLGQLKEEWGVSMQALLFRARRLGVMSDTTYRNAMTRVSALGWRRREPGAMPEVEQPSLLPRSVELLRQTGLTRQQLASECRVPQTLFDTITARAPVAPPADEPRAPCDGSVVSILSWRSEDEATSGP